MITVNKEGIINLWQKTFGDTREYIESFIVVFSDKAEFLIKEADGKVVSMLCMIDCTMAADSKEYKGRYIYACATDENYKKRGLITELLDDARIRAEKEDCDFLVLVPANDALFDFYEKRGYSKFFKVKVIEIPGRILKILAKGDATEAVTSVEEINKMRKLLTKRPNVLWSDEQISFINGVYPSENSKVLYAPNVGYAFLREENKTVYVDEICAGAQDFCKMLGVIDKNTEAENYCFNVPVDCPFTADSFEIKDKGMILPLKNKFNPDGYIGLVME